MFDGLSNAEMLGRTADQALIDGSTGSALTEDLLVGHRGGTGRFALVYSTNGRDIRLNTSVLAAGVADAFWIDPRTGAVTRLVGSFATGPGTPVTVFNPPGTPGPENDWILKVTLR